MSGNDAAAPINVVADQPTSDESASIPAATGSRRARTSVGSGSHKVAAKPGSVDERRRANLVEAVARRERDVEQAKAGGIADRGALAQNTDRLFRARENLIAFNEEA